MYIVCKKDCNKYFNCISKSMGHLSLPKECVTSGGLLSTNILWLGYNMATGHGPLSKVYKMEPQRQKKIMMNSMALASMLCVC